MANQYHLDTSHVVVPKYGVTMQFLDVSIDKPGQKTPDNAVAIKKGKKILIEFVSEDLQTDIK